MHIQYDKDKSTPWFRSLASVNSVEKSFYSYFGIEFYYAISEYRSLQGTDPFDEVLCELNPLYSGMIQTTIKIAGYTVRLWLVRCSRRKRLAKWVTSSQYGAVLLLKPLHRPRGNRGGQRRAWKSMHYGLSLQWFKRVLAEFGRNLCKHQPWNCSEWPEECVHYPDWDCYNCVPALAKANKYFTKDDNAYNFSWRGLGLLWACPPYDQFELLISKLVWENLVAIVVAPVWRDKCWWQPLKSITIQSYGLPLPETGVPLYEDETGRLLPQRLWPTRAFLVDGALGLPPGFVKRRFAPKVEDSSWDDTPSE